MSKRTNKDFLLDIREAIRRIEMYTEGMSYRDFLKKLETQDAVLRNLEIIGEAAKNISPDLQNKHKDIQWKEIAGMRDKIIHFYFGVNLDIVWRTSKDKLPLLKKKIEKIIQEEESN